MTTPERHSEHEAVGAYALGVLDPADAAHFETHLAGCAYCQEQLDGFMGLEPLLATLAEAPTALGDPGILHARPSPPLFDRLVDEVAVARRKRQRRGLWLVAAAVALIVGGPVVTSMATDAPNSGRGIEAKPPSATPSPPEDAFSQMEDKVQATDPQTKVTATVGTERKAWGTNTMLELKNVKGPLKCSLVAVSKNGERQVVTTWAVPKWGYGIPDSNNPTAKKPLYVTGGSAMERDQIDHFEVRTLDGQRLVSVGA